MEAMGSITVDVIKGTSDVKGKKVTITSTKEKGVFKLQTSALFKATKHTITNIEWEHKEGRSAGKAAVGAIGGGLLAGPLGLIAGAAVGGKKNEESTAVIELRNKKTEKIEQLHVKMKAKDYETLSSWL